MESMKRYIAILLCAGCATTAPKPVVRVVAPVPPMPTARVVKANLESYKSITTLSNAQHRIVWIVSATFTNALPVNLLRTKYGHRAKSVVGPPAHFPTQDKFKCTYWQFAFEDPYRFAFWWSWENVPAGTCEAQITEDGVHWTTLYTDPFKTGEVLLELVFVPDGMKNRLMRLKVSQP